MIKIAYASDLHRESNMTPLNMPHGMDVVVLCGDINVGARATIKTVTDVQEIVQCTVILVLGNHEFYDGVPMQDTIKQIRREFQFNKSIHLLENTYVDIGKVRFIGGTLWTDFKAHGDENLSAMFVATKLMDYEKINVNTSKGVKALSHLFWLNKHNFTRSFIQHEVVNSKLPTVVITHHGGHLKLNGKARFKQSPLRAGFVSDIPEIRPDIWISGHAHEQMSFKDDGTLFVSNSYGYEGHEPLLVDSFVWKFVELGEKKNAK